MTKYTPVICQACHKVVLIDGADPYAHRILADAGWTYDGKDYVCCGKPKAQPVREAYQSAFIRWAKDTKFNHKVGAQAAMQGYECLSADPDYVKGYLTGMSLRHATANLPFAPGMK